MACRASGVEFWPTCKLDFNVVALKSTYLITKTQLTTKSGQMSNQSIAGSKEFSRNQAGRGISQVYDVCQVQW
jgi:hypothetical protein